MHIFLDSLVLLQLLGSSAEQQCARLLILTLGILHWSQLPLRKQEVQVFGLVNVFVTLALQIETAVRLLLPGELGKHALSEGRKAVVSGLS